MKPDDPTKVRYTPTMYSQTLAIREYSISVWERRGILSVKEGTNLKHRIFIEQVALLFKQYTLSALSGLVISMVVVLTLWKQVPVNLLLVWFFTQSAFLLSGIFLVWRRRHTENSVSEPQLWFRRYLVVITSVGFMWGGLAYFLNYNLPPFYQTFVLMVALGAAASSLVLAIPHLTAYYTFLTLPLLPGMLWLLIQVNFQPKIIAVLGVLFYGLLVLTGRNLNHSIVKTIRLRFRNADLVAKVKEFNNNLEKRVKKKSQALYKSEERFNLAMRGANDGLWDWNFGKNRIYYSPRWKAMLGYEDNEITSSPTERQQRIHPADLEKVSALIQKHLKGVTESYESIHRMKHKDGHYIWVLERGRAVRDHTGVANRIVGTQLDITDHKVLEKKLQTANMQLKHEIKERKIAQKELAHLAKHDPLTGLPNRLLFSEQLHSAIRRAEINKESVAVLLVDLDNFKNVNDTLGHPTGDQLLAIVSNRLETIADKNIFLSRFGGDEFFFVLEGWSDISYVDDIATKIIDIMAQPYQLEGNVIRIGCSIGITRFPEQGKTPDILIQDADIAMYHAKAQGRNTFRHFTIGMDQEITEKAMLRNLLHGALDRNEFEVFYQPQINIKTGNIIGLEALLRWHTPEMGNVLPDKFIPLLEETGMIDIVGEWLMREACSQTTYLHEHGHPEMKVAVNMSPLQFLQNDMPDRVKHILKETRLDANYLDLEITENIFMEDLDLINRSLSKLVALGVDIILDDFGTGYSSLGYIKRLPIDGVKIDKMFVHDMMKSDGNRELVAAIIAMWQGLSMKTLVAEGVETQLQLDLLQKTGCPTYQGFLFSRPLSSVALNKMLLQNNIRISG